MRRTVPPGTYSIFGSSGPLEVRTLDEELSDLRNSMGQARNERGGFGKPAALEIQRMPESRGRARVRYLPIIATKPVVSHGTYVITSTPNSRISNIGSEARATSSTGLSKR